MGASLTVKDSNAIAVASTAVIAALYAAWQLLNTCPVVSIDYFGEYLIKEFQQLPRDDRTELLLDHAPDVRLSLTGWRVDSLIRVHGTRTTEAQDECVTTLKGIACEKRWHLRNRTTVATIEFVDPGGSVSRTVRFTAPTPGY